MVVFRSGTGMFQSKPPIRQGKAGRRKVPEKSRKKPGAPKAIRQPEEEGRNSGKFISITSFPDRSCLYQLMQKYANTLLPHFSFLERLKNTRIIFFLQMQGPQLLSLYLLSGTSQNQRRYSRT